MSDGLFVVHWCLIKSRYCQLIATLKPDMWQALVDSDTVANASKKRVKKALERNEVYLRKCVEARDQLPVRKKKKLSRRSNDH